jgi:hypothetical protein
MSDKRQAACREWARRAEPAHLPNPPRVQALAMMEQARRARTGRHQDRQRHESCLRLARWWRVHGKAVLP